MKKTLVLKVYYDKGAGYRGVLKAQECIRINNCEGFIDVCSSAYIIVLMYPERERLWLPC